MSPIFVLGILVSILFCGLTLDIGRMELKKTQMQNAADAAANGAELESEHGVSAWIAAGKTDAALNGFTDGQNGVTISVSQNPSSGLYTGRYDAIQVTITQNFKTIFMGVLNSNPYNIQVQSTALVPACNTFLGDTSAQYPYTLTLTNSTINSTCPVYVNASYSTDSNSKIYGFGFNVSGSLSASRPLGSSSQQSQGPGSPSSSQLPNFGIPTITDPLVTFSQPAFSGCNGTSYKITSGTATINPGTYCGTSSTPGLTISNATVTLSPGLYIITGGAKWDNATINGTGVTLFFTSGNGAGDGQVLIGSSSACTLNLSAPADVNNGTFSLLFWLDRSWINTGATDFQFTGAGSFTGDGLWYMPATGLSIASNAVTFSHYGSFIARNATFANTTINSGQDLSALPYGSLFRLTQGVLVQ